jgi:type VI secretion system protein ImpK
VRSGEGFFAVLKQLVQSPAANLPVIELMYYCLSLGFQGQYRLSPRGPAELDRVREDTYSLIARQRAPVEAGLSPHWKGQDAPYRPRRAELPLWVAATAALALLGGVFAWVSLALNSGSDALFEQLAAAPPAAMPVITRSNPVEPPPPPVEPGALERLRGFLAPEVAAHLVSVVGTEAVPVVRISGTGMFASGSATLEPRFLGLLGRIGEALKTEPGPVTVAGYTDNQPIRTVKFPSNFQLSAARAQSAVDVMARSIGDPARLRAEGRGNADPLASNDTVAGREMNRRIEVILHRQG